jgi:hypothetical protein
MTTPPQQPGYPEQPTNPYGVPAYPGEAHPQQPGYPQPENTQPGYPQPEYPQPGYQQPAYPGQSPYSQQPTYQQPGYQQPGYPPYPQPPAYPGGAYPGGYPTGGYPGPARPAPVRPSSVNAAFLLWMLVLVVSVISGVLLFTGGYYDAIQAEIDSSNLSGIESSLALSAGKTVLIVGALLGLAISLFIYLFFGLKMRAGRNWARIVATVLGGLAVLSGVAGNSLTGMSDVNVARPEGSAILGWLSVALAAGAIIAMYLPASNTYFRESKLYRSTPR